MMMVSANDAAYAIAETAGGSLAGFAAAAQRDRQAVRHAGQHIRRSRRPRRRHVVQGRAEGQCLRPGDRHTQRARPSPRSPSGPRRRTYQFTDVTGAPHQLTNHNKFLPDGELRIPRRQRIQDGLHQAGEPLAGRDGQPRRPRAHRRDPGRGRQRLHVGRVAPRPGIRDAARHRGNGHPVARRRGLALRHPARTA